MFDDAGIDKKVVNHTGRVYCCFTLYNAGFEEQEVMKLAVIEVLLSELTKKHLIRNKEKFQMLCNLLLLKPSVEKENEHHP